MPSIGGVPLHVTNENVNMNNKVTDKPLEDKSSISDDIYQEPDTISVDFTVSRNGKEVASQLKKLRNSSKVYKYNGVDFNYSNMAIKSLSIPRNANIKDGFEGSMQLQQVQIVEETSRVTKLGVEPTTGQQVQKTSEEVSKREAETMEITSTNSRKADLMAYGSRFEEGDTDAS